MIVNNNTTTTDFNLFDVRQSVDTFIRTHTDVIDQRFIQELAEVTAGSKSVEDIALTSELRETLSMEEQNLNYQSEIALQLLEINQDLFLRIYQTVEQFIDNQSMHISSDPDTNENMTIIEPEQTSYPRCFTGVLSGFVMLFNINHRILIQLIEQNGVVTTRFEEYYKAIIHAIEENSTFQNYPIILATACESYQRLRMIIQIENDIYSQQIESGIRPQQIENNTHIEQIHRRNYQISSILAKMMGLTGIMILAAFILTYDYDYRILMSMVISLTMFLLIK